MDNARVGTKEDKTVKIMVDGKEYNLYYPIGAFATLQRYFKDQYGTRDMQKGLTEIINNQDMDGILQLLAVGINFGGDQSVTKEFLGKAITFKDMQDVMGSVQEALAKVFPAPEEVTQMNELIGKNEDELPQE